jgi:hypothetical protein
MTELYDDDASEAERIEAEELAKLGIVSDDEEEIEAIKAAFWDDDDAWEPRSPRYGEDR